uniref:Uncharacterized protein n=1 Tax=Anguilla anguilla TaxID=7936 RepID=A0A0E9QQM1_ANGAN
MLKNYRTKDLFENCHFSQSHQILMLKMITNSLLDIGKYPAQNVQITQSSLFSF